MEPAAAVRRLAREGIAEGLSDWLGNGTADDEESAEEPNGDLDAGAGDGDLESLDAADDGGLEGASAGLGNGGDLDGGGGGVDDEELVSRVDELEIEIEALAAEMETVQETNAETREIVDDLEETIDDLQDVHDRIAEYL